jgi:hypothetical protein
MKSIYEEFLIDLSVQFDLPVEMVLRTEEIVMNGITVRFINQEEQAMIGLLANVGCLNEGQAQAQMRLLLEANMMWAGTGGATLSVLPGSDTVLLTHLCPMYEIDMTILAENIAIFVDVAAFWIAKLTEKTEKIHFLLID